MAKLSESLKYELMGKIHAGVPLRDLVQSSGIKYPKLLALRHELKDARANGTLSDLLDVEELVVSRVKEEIMQDAKALGMEEAIEGEVLEATSAINGAQLLDSKLRTTAMNITTKLGRMAHETSSASELVFIAEALCKMQTAFFNKGTQVNIQNNLNGEDSRFKRFLQD